MFFTPVRCSLREWLKTFCVQSGGGDSEDLSKGVFCYNALSKLSDLQRSTKTIKLADFNDLLTGGNQLARPYREYARLMVKGGYNEEKVLQTLKLTKRPLRGSEVFRRLRNYWSARKLHTLRDVLADYAVRDTVPLYEGCCGFLKAFSVLGLGNAFHCYLSLAQMSFHYMMKHSQAAKGFHLLNEDFYRALKSKMIGGPGESGIDMEDDDDDRTTCVFQRWF